MGRFHAYIKKNGFFVLLCVTFLLISLSLLGYKLYREWSIQEPAIQQPEKPITTPVDDSNAEFTSFSGEYDHNSQQAKLRWTLNSGKHSVERIRLYLVKQAGTENEVEEMLIDVTNYSSYDLSQSLYGLMTGTNTFRIKALLEDGTTVESTTAVELPKILSISQSEEMKSNGEATVTLTYVYGKQNPVGNPELKPFNDVVVSYKEAGVSTKESNGFVTVTVKYQFTWDPALRMEPFTIRWYFAQIGFNKDFLTNFVLTD